MTDDWLQSDVGGGSESGGNGELISDWWCRIASLFHTMYDAPTYMYVAHIRMHVYK